MENCDEKNVSEKTQFRKDESHEVGEDILYTYYITLTFLTITLLGLLSLCRIITINPAWFCIPICILNTIHLLRILRTTYRAQQMKISVSKLYIKKLENDESNSNEDH